MTEFVQRVDSLDKKERRARRIAGGLRRLTYACGVVATVDFAIMVTSTCGFELEPSGAVADISSLSFLGGIYVGATSFLASIATTRYGADRRRACEEMYETEFAAIESSPEFSDFRYYYPDHPENQE